MEKGITSEYLLLSDRNIACSAEETGSFLSSSKVERREALRIKLVLEEVLLNCRERFGEEAAYRIRWVDRFPTIKVEVTVPGEAFDPLGKTGEADDVIQSLLAGIGLMPVWSYKRGRNHIVFTAKKKPLSDTVKIVLAIGLAVLAGLILRALPEGISAGINDYILAPGSDAFMGLISAVSGPLIFLSVLGSICSMGNIETFGRIGTKTIKILILYMLVIGIFATGIGCLFYSIRLGGGGEAGFSQVMELIYDIIPANLFEPFITGNAMQLIFIAIVVGIAMLALSSRVSGVFRLVEQFFAIMQTVMAGLSALFPVLIFLLFTGMIFDGNTGVVLGSWKLLAVILLLMGAYYAAAFLKVVFTKKISPLLLFKKVWPTFLIVLTTASSAAAFVTNTRDTTEKLGVDRKLTDFGVPLGQVLFMPDTFIVLFGIEIFLADACAIPITLPWLAVGFCTNFLLALAVPPVPGGTMMGLTIAFLQLGIPMEMMGIALAVNAIADFPGSAISVSGWQLTLIDIADSLELLDRDVLLDEGTKP